MISAHSMFLCFKKGFVAPPMSWQPLAFKTFSPLVHPQNAAESCPTQGHAPPFPLIQRQWLTELKNWKTWPLGLNMGCLWLRPNTFQGAHAYGWDFDWTESYSKPFLSPRLISSPSLQKTAWSLISKHISNIPLVTVSKETNLWQLVSGIVQEMGW